MKPIGNKWATFDEDTGYTEEKNPHISGTIPRGTKLEFWLSIPRPKGVSVDEWEEIQQAKWDRIFPPKKEVV